MASPTSETTISFEFVDNNRANPNRPNFSTSLTFKHPDDIMNLIPTLNTDLDLDLNVAGDINIASTRMGPANTLRIGDLTLNTDDPDLVRDVINSTDRVMPLLRLQQQSRLENLAAAGELVCFVVGAAVVALAI